MAVLPPGSMHHKLIQEMQKWHRAVDQRRRLLVDALAAIRKGLVDKEGFSTSSVTFYGQDRAPRFESQKSHALLSALTPVEHDQPLGDYEIGLAFKLREGVREQVVKLELCLAHKEVELSKPSGEGLKAVDAFDIAVDGFIKGAVTGTGADGDFIVSQGVYDGIFAAASKGFSTKSTSSGGLVPTK